MTPEVQIHVFAVGSEDAERMLLFRERFRANRDERTLYEEAKRRLAARSWTRVQDYADAKSEVVEEIIAPAREARLRTHRRPGRPKAPNQDLLTLTAVRPTNEAKGHSETSGCLPRSVRLALLLDCRFSCGALSSRATTEGTLRGMSGCH